MTEHPDSPRWFTVGEIAVMVDLSVSTVRRDIELGELPATKRRGRRGWHWIAEADAQSYVRRMGGRWRFDAAS